MRMGRGGRRQVPCKCVFREIFRQCFGRFRRCVQCAKYLSRVTGEIYGSNGQRRIVWSRKIEEYIADFELVARRTLTAEEWRVFSAHYLLGAEWRLCCSQLGLAKGDFFHTVYRIQQKLGRAFRELTPYALFPLDEYFSPMMRSANRQRSLWELYWNRVTPNGQEPPARMPVPLRPPLRPKAPVIPFPEAPLPDQVETPAGLLAPVICINDARPMRRGRRQEDSPLDLCA